MKKFICILLSTVMIFAFAACGQKADEETTTAEPTTTAPTTTAPTTTAPTTTAPTTTAPTTAAPTTAAPTTAAPTTTAPTTTAPTTAAPTTTAPTTAAPTTTAPTTAKAAKNVSLSEVRGIVLKASGITGEMDIPTGKLTELYGIDQKDIKQSAGFFNMNGAFPEEAVMVEAVDSAAAKRIAGLMQTRLDDVKNQSASYDPDSLAVVQECRVIQTGNFIALFLARGHVQMENAFTAEVG